jgi:hypothetical protein
MILIYDIQLVHLLVGKYSVKDIFCFLIQVHGSPEIYRGYQLTDGCLSSAFTNVQRTEAGSV